MKHSKTSLILFLLATGLAIQYVAMAQYTVPYSVLGNGGGLISSTDNHMAGTIGQPVIGIISNSSNSMALGFWHMTGSLATGVEDILKTDQKGYRLDQNYPNPFYHVTTIKFAVPKHSSVTLKLYDMQGREVITLIDEDLPPGEHHVELNAKDLPGGIYFYRLETAGFCQSKKLTLLR
jgi:hypothetical protein